MINNLEDVLKLNKTQIKELSQEDKEKVIEILKAEIERIEKRNQK
jgi:hypothetical protein